MIMEVVEGNIIGHGLVRAEPISVVLKTISFLIGTIFSSYPVSYFSWHCPHSSSILITCSRFSPHNLHIPS